MTKLDRWAAWMYILAFTINGVLALTDVVKSDTVAFVIHGSVCVILGFALYLLYRRKRRA